MTDPSAYDELPDHEWESIGRFDGPEAKKILDRLEAAAVPVRADFHDGRRLLNEDEDDAGRGRRMGPGIYIRVPAPLRERAYALRDEALGLGAWGHGDAEEDGEPRERTAPESGQTFLDVNTVRIVCPVDEGAIGDALRELNATEGGGYVGLHHAAGAVLQVNGNDDFGYFLILHPGPGEKPVRSEGELEGPEIRAALIGFLVEGPGWRGGIAWAEG